MKQVILAVSLLIIVSSLAAQSSLPPYKRFPNPPVGKFLQTDSTTWVLNQHLQKNKSLWLMLFSPECDHCKHETEELIAHIDAFKNVQIIMASTYPLHEINAFAQHYNLATYPNIKVIRDYGYLLPVYFDVKNMPYNAFYDKHKKLISTFEGTMPITNVIELFK